ncbi:MAG: hypothetical protein KME17_08020 [Cyanosarcina radialis HA8281-LM2]|nr:hypothetical protein [Cyanosarcina radialis HA8281-LM2]
MSLTWLSLRSATSQTIPNPKSQIPNSEIITDTDADRETTTETEER